MSDRKHRFRAFGLTLLAALGLMVFMAAGAQANWLYLEKSGALKELTANELVNVTKHTEHGTLLIANVNISILCNKIEGEDLLLEVGTANASGQVAFSECVAIEKSTGLEVPKCNPINQPIKAAGKALVILHTNGQNYVLLEPNKIKNAKGEEEFVPFTTIKFSELCASIETSNVTGSTVLECGQLNGSGVFVQEDCKNHQVKHLIRQAPEELFPEDVLKFGVHVSLIDGIAGVELGGPLAGLAWSGEV